MQFLGSVAVVAGAQVLPAATWLPPVRRLLPALESPMPVGETAITFDDGPHPEGTPAVLDALDALDWRATFFMLGSSAARFPDVAREVARRGHAIGVHGSSHRYLLARTPRATWNDVHHAARVVSHLTGCTVQWWRPPYGVLTTAGLASARAARLRPLLWSAWGKDWRNGATPDSITRAVLRGRVAGGTVLLHDSDATSARGSWRATVQSLPSLAEQLARRGLRVAPLPGLPPVV